MTQTRITVNDTSALLDDLGANGIERLGKQEAFRIGELSS